MATNTLIDLDDRALLDRLTEAREELFNLRFQNATGQLTNTARLKQVRKEIARCLTEARSREIAAAEELEETAPVEGAPAAEATPTDADEASAVTADDGADE